MIDRAFWRTQHDQGRGNRKLTPETVREARRLLAADFSQRETADLLGVSKSAIGDMASGRNWGWVR